MKVLTIQYYDQKRIALMIRTGRVFSEEGRMILEEHFKRNNYVSFEERRTLAELLGVRPRQVQIWFQNRRNQLRSKFTSIRAATAVVSSLPNMLFEEPIHLFFERPNAENLPNMENLPIMEIHPEDGGLGARMGLYMAGEFEQLKQFTG